MREWSPECTQVTWTSTPPDSGTTPATSGSGATPAPSDSGTTYAVPGARFIGHNRAGVVRWFTQGEVVDASPGRRFSFRIHFGPIPIALWTYEFTPTENGCQVTESWTDLRPTAFSRPARLIFGNRTTRNRTNIQQTLTALKATAESPHPT